MSDANREQADDDRLVLGLIDVLELIAPGAHAHTWAQLPARSSRLDRVDLTMPSGAEVSIIVRRYPADTDRQVVLREAATLERLRQSPVQAPQVLWLDTDGTVFGVPGVAYTLVPGGSAVTGDPADWGASLAVAIANVHLFPGELLEHLPAGAHADDLVPTAVPLAGPREPQTLALLRARSGDVALTEARLAHGRIRPSSVRTDDGVVSGLVGWRGALRTDPMIDLGAAHLTAWLLGGEPAATALLDTYRERTTRHSPLLGWFGLVALADFHADELAAVAGGDARLEQWLDWALAPIDA